MNKNLQNLLLQNHTLEPQAQGDALLSEFLSWKSQQEQVDDICFIGLKI